MNEKIKSSEANQIIINAINTKINELIKTGSTQSTATDEVIEVGNEQYIPKDQLSTYEKLAELNNYIDFNEENKSEVYMFNMPSQENKQFKKMKHLYVPIKDAEKLAAIASEIEKHLNIKFPQELYQLKYKNTLLPNHNYEAPHPRLASETEEAYETRIAAHYDKDGTKTEMLEEGSDIRKPYPHETIDYKKGKIEYSDARNAYYDNYIVEKGKEPFRKRKEAATKKAKNIGKLAVKAVKNPSQKLLTNIRNIAKDCKLIPSYFKDRKSSNPKLIVAATAGTVITAGIVGMQVLTGVASFTLPGLVIEGFAIAMVYKDFKKWKNSRKKPEEPINKPPAPTEPEEEVEETNEFEWTYEEFMIEFSKSTNTIQLLRGEIAKIEDEIKIYIENVKEAFLLTEGREITDEELKTSLAANQKYIEKTQKLKEYLENLKKELIRAHKLLENINKINIETNEKGRGGR